MKRSQDDKKRQEARGKRQEARTERKGDWKTVARKDAAIE